MSRRGATAVVEELSLLLLLLSGSHNRRGDGRGGAGCCRGGRSTSGDGVPELKARLAALMPESAWHYPEDQVSDASERLLACEITREQLYRQLHDELPYDSAVRPESYTVRKDGSVEIHQQIVIARDSQKGIVLGKGGSKLKAIGEAARKELANLLGQKVHLFLHVKVEEGWADSNKEIYEEIGLEWVR